MSIYDVPFLNILRNCVEYRGISEIPDALFMSIGQGSMLVNIISYD